jgi:hypothetical protein
MGYFPTGSFPEQRRDTGELPDDIYSHTASDDFQSGEKGAKA